MVAWKWFFRSLVSLSLCLSLTGDRVFAGDPGGACEPGVDSGHVARLVSLSGDILLFDGKGNSLATVTEAIVPSGSRIETAPGASVELAIEDGTVERSSRIAIDGGSELIITGGLYCSDLRPKADGGRWSVREVAVQLGQGGIEIEIASGVSHSFDLEVRTANATARMIRGTQDRMAAQVRRSGLADRSLVSLVDHPKIRGHVTALTGGREIGDLSPRDRQGIMAQAAQAAISMGLIDLESLGVLENPQIQGTMEAMTRGRKLDELPENERAMITQAMGGMAMQMGLLDLEQLQVPGEPDERTVVAVEAGKMRVHNRNRGWKRAEAVDVEAGMATEVRGHDLPTPPVPLEN